MLLIYGTTNVDNQNAILSRTPFLKLMHCPRFDNKDTQKKRKRKDNLAAIRELLEEFSAHLQDAWNLDEEVIIKETLRKCCGHCQFKIYNLAKPEKYRILSRVITDAFPRYVYKMKLSKLEHWFKR